MQEFRKRSKVQKRRFRAGSVAKRSSGASDPRRPIPKATATRFGTLPTRNHYFGESLKCPKIAASGRNFRRDCREHCRGQTYAFRPRSDAKTAAPRFGMERFGVGVFARTCATRPMRNHNVGPSGVCKTLRTSSGVKSRDFCAFEWAPRAEPLLSATLEADKHSTTAGCPLARRYSGSRPGHP